jgi:hypothetical protein
LFYLLVVCRNGTVIYVRYINLDMKMMQILGCQWPVYRSKCSGYVRSHLKPGLRPRSRQHNMYFFHSYVCHTVLLICYVRQSELPVSSKLLFTETVASYMFRSFDHYPTLYKLRNVALTITKLLVATDQLLRCYCIAM